ncbi:BamA/TamA family outer membrane protein [Mucilaginibacter dorajii]|uniref:Bacterial surface antigen (D15) domain-containing protein n=1 Tax=Mucilaginibacter dorajii TaxID=692994 RepID=A0ABP7QN51_9SPHI|nr:BamA/TamA family outer membrane protein [Mucilaginibacter dorajii]MCS3733748.1 hypothetical protein [Mucilaginibacter dorajii]
MKKVLLVLTIGLVSTLAKAQEGPITGVITQDSVEVRVHEQYDKVTGFHRWLFGENYRKEWGALTKLPVLRISQLHGGLTPEQLGGGFQTTSLRMVDPTGKEWVLRSVEKDPSKTLPEQLRQTFAADWELDAMSAQHPFSALIVPPLAIAAGVPHATPIIGVVSGDKNFGKYNATFAGKVCLFEEREPTGKSKNVQDVMQDLYDDNDNSFDSHAWLTARCLDLLVGDWDRHDDNWRFTKDKEDGKKVYTGIPRDRDQAFYINQGVLPSLASSQWLVPFLQGYGGEINDIRFSMWTSVFLDRYPSARMSYKDWMKIVNDFVAVETDDVLEQGLKRLPAASYKIRHDELFKQLKERRANIPAAMDYYYRFINRIIDIHTSNKNEQISITDAPDNGLNIAINKITKSGNVKDTIINANFDPAITKEIRIYTGEGSDRVILNNQSSPIKLRFVDSLGHKEYNIVKSKNKVPIYDRGDDIQVTGDKQNVSLHLSKDSSNTAYLPVNPINVWMPLADVGLNKDDGFILGAGFRFTHQNGFRKLPYNDMQQLLVSHSFSTKAFSLSYTGEWIHAFGQADFTINTLIKAPDNTINFFGRGNETQFDKSGDYVRYYRTRFNTYQLDPAFRWKGTKGTSFSIGPSLQYYHYNAEDNVGRFINNTSLIKSYDSLSVDKAKLHAGVVAIFTNDKRNNKMLPTSGTYLNVKVQGYAGLNNNSKSYLQVIPEFGVYQSLGSAVVLADRIGGGVTAGKSAFYQSLFLGGEGNLLGYRQFRFAGQHMAYNNFETRIRLTNISSYILPGELGLMGFYDTGRVWIKEESSDKWHNGVGGGLYFEPAGLTVVQLLAGHSEEGWYPYFSLNFRF